MITLLTKFQAKDDESLRELADVMSSVGASVPSEHGHLVYDVFEVEGDPYVRYVIEGWESRADADRHAARVTDDGVLDRVAPLLVEAPDTQTLTAVPSPSAD